MCCGLREWAPVGELCMHQCSVIFRTLAQVDDPLVEPRRFECPRRHFRQRCGTICGIQRAKAVLRPGSVIRIAGIQGRLSGPEGAGRPGSTIRGARPRGCKRPGPCHCARTAELDQKPAKPLGGKPFSTLMYSATLVMKFWFGEKTLNIMLRGSAPKVVGCSRNCERYGP